MRPQLRQFRLRQAVRKYREGVEHLYRLREVLAHQLGNARAARDAADQENLVHGLAARLGGGIDEGLAHLRLQRQELGPQDLRERRAEASPAAPIPGAEGGGEQDPHLCRLQDARRDRGQDFPGRRRRALPGHCRADEPGPLEACRGAQPLLDISAPPDANGTGGAVAAFRGGGGDRSGIARRAQVMAELDLIPADYAQRQILRRRVKRFVAAVVSLACLLTLARGGLHLLASAETGEVARLQGQERLWAQSKAKVEEYTKQKLATQRQLVALDELRGRDRLRLFLKAMDAAHVENVWFDEIRYYRRDNLPTTGNLDSLPGGARAGIIVVPEKNIPAPG